METQSSHMELKQRGLIMHEGGGTLDEILSKRRKMYVGIEPTADSLHVGNLVPVILLKHLHDLGHEPFLLVGGGTGLIGDPKESGERTLLNSESVARNARAIKKQLSKILDKDNLVVFDNAQWLKKLNLIEFLRDVGKHFTVNQLIKREIIKRRLETDEDSISYTEFSYSLLQAYDYLHLYEQHKIDLQIGGSDQWANIVSGVDLIRRKKGKSTFALTTPIVVDKATGKKFGKSEGNAIWLDPKKTSPFNFFQFWINVSDENVEEYLKIFSFLPLAKIFDIIKKHKQEPHKRIAQRTLAKEITTFVHGSVAAESAEKASNIIYGTEVALPLSREDRKMILAELPHVHFSQMSVSQGISITEALVSAQLTQSKAEARRLLEGGGISINGQSANAASVINNEHFQDGLVLIRKGKKIAILLKK